MKNKPSFNFTQKTEISKNLIDLLRGMLEKEPSKRLTIDEVIEHPWLQE